MDKTPSVKELIKYIRDGKYVPPFDKVANLLESQAATIKELKGRLKRHEEKTSEIASYIQNNNTCEDGLIGDCVYKVGLAMFKNKDQEIERLKGALEKCCHCKLVNTAAGLQYDNCPACEALTPS